MHEERRIIETDRLILRPVSETDAEDIYAIGSDQETAYWAGMHRYDNLDDAICEIWCLDGYGITVKGEDRVIGLVGVNESADATNNWTTQLGYFLSKECRGHGYMPEAVSAICNNMFETDCTERVMLEIRQDNIPSREVARKCGFTQNENQTHWRHNLYDMPLDEFILERGNRKCA